MIDKRALKSVAEDLVAAARRLEAVSGALSWRVRKLAQEGDEPPAEPPAEEGGGDFKDEGTTGEEGGDEGAGAEGDIGDLGDLGGAGGLGGAGAGGGGLGGAPPAGGFGADTAAEGAGGGAGETGWEKDVAGLRTELDGVKRTLVNVLEVLKRVRDPLADPARGNDAMQSV